ncbi:MAG: aldo/keto reductase, partial [Acidobacteriota bacterium]|nr:aldo/keto reductase [Acidobacteriota bacterium]
RPPLTAAWAQSSLERSLLALQTDRIDIFLLHEPRPELLTDSDLPGFLEDSVRRGTIGQFGVGGDIRHLGAVYRSHPEYCPVVQCGWSVLEAAPPHFPGSQLIVFGVLSGLAGRKDLAPAALRAAALVLPDSTILFSSRKSAHVTAGARALSDSSLDPAARQLLANTPRSILD